MFNMHMSATIPKVSRRVLSIAVAVLLALGIFAFTPMAASAASGDLYIGGTDQQLSDNNISGPGWHWSGAPDNTLTLSNEYNRYPINIVQDGTYEAINIVVSGDVEIDASLEDLNYGISMNGGLMSFSGSGTLTIINIVGVNEISENHGVGISNLLNTEATIECDIKFSGSKINIKGTSGTGINASGKTTINSKSEIGILFENDAVDSTSNGVGINSGSDVLITGSTVNITYSAPEGGENEGIYSTGNVTIAGDELNITAKKGIRTVESNVTIDGGIININSAGDGIYTEPGLDGIFGGTVTINGGKLNINSAGNGIYASKGNVTINGGTVTIVAGGAGISSEDNALEKTFGIVKINGGTIDIKAGLDGVFASQELLLYGGAGSILYIKNDGLFWAVKVKWPDTIDVDKKNLIIMGWDGKAYSLDAVPKPFDHNGNEVWSFFDAADLNGQPLSGIQWGPRGTQVTPGPDFDLESDDNVGVNVLSRNGVPQTSDSTGFLIGAIVLLAAVGGTFIMVAYRRRLTSK